MKTWSEILNELSSSPFGTKVTILKNEIISPKDAGAVKSIGVPYGQIADWRFKPETNCTGLHIHEYSNEWVAHLDQVHPQCSLIRHLKYDAPGTLLTITSSTGLILGKLLKNKPMIGGGIGFFAGLGLILTNKRSAKAP